MYIEGRKIKNFADIQRNFLYEVSFSTAHSLVPGWTEEDVTLRARSFSIPQRGNEPIESNFGAMKQFFPGKPTFGHTIQIQFEETESQGVQRFLHAWQQRIFNLNSGHAVHSRKRGDNGTFIDNSNATGICDVVTIKAFRFNGEALENKYYLFNAWLQNVDDVNIDYSQNDAVKFNATFQFDFWTYGTTFPVFNSNGTSPTETIGVNFGIFE
jgi:hypothetical protein